jgi:hypothetical protein
LYIMQKSFPYISIKKIKNFGKTNKKEVENYILKAVLSNQAEIDDFMFTFFMENWESLTLDDFKLFKNNEKKFNTHFSSNKNFTLSTTISLETFSETDTFLNQILMNYDGNSMHFRVHFTFFNDCKLQSAKNFIKNLSLFWISG